MHLGEGNLHESYSAQSFHTDVIQASNETTIRLMGNLERFSAFCDHMKRSQNIKMIHIKFYQSHNPTAQSFTFRAQIGCTSTNWEWHCTDCGIRIFKHSNILFIEKCLLPRLFNSRKTCTHICVFVSLFPFFLSKCTPFSVTATEPCSNTSIWFSCLKFCKKFCFVFHFGSSGMSSTERTLM